MRRSKEARIPKSEFTHRHHVPFPLYRFIPRLAFFMKQQKANSYKYSPRNTRNTRKNRGKKVRARK
jgi:hypothetical protein